MYTCEGNVNPHKLTEQDFETHRVASCTWTIALVGVHMVLLAHDHYTIDIIIAYYITTRLFWTYYTLTNNAFLIKHSGSNNYLAREFWYRWSGYCLYRGLDAFNQNSRMHATISATTSSATISATTSSFKNTS